MRDCKNKKANTMRYFVTNDTFHPFVDQPKEGYTKSGAIARAKREAKAISEFKDIPLIETVEWVHIMNEDYHYCSELDDDIRTVLKEG